MTHPARLIAAPILVAALGFLSASIARAGDLDPPVGPVAPTMKPLADVEPRTAVNATNTPSSAGGLFTISASGSYYLTGNIDTPPGLSAIRIDASNVTLDLQGFTIDGASAGVNRNGIVGDASISGVVVRNGIVVNWSNNCLNFEETPDVRIEDVRAESAGDTGIFCSDDATIAGCTVRSCNTGILCAQRATITGATVSGCATSGIGVLDDATISDTTTTQNTQSGIDASSGARCRIHRCSATANGQWGIRAGTDALVSESTSSGNQSGIEVNARSLVTRCNASNNSGFGVLLSLGPSSSVVGCSVSQNSVGIEAGDAFIEGCTLDANEDAVVAFGSTIMNNCIATGSTGIAFTFTIGTDAVATACVATDGPNDGGFVCMADRVRLIGCTSNANSVGFVLLGNGCRLEGCTASGNTGDGFVDFGLRCHAQGLTANTNGGTGIRFVGSDALVVRSAAAGNTAADFTVTVPDNAHGPIVDLSAGGDASAVTNADHPLANVIY